MRSAGSLSSSAARGPTPRWLAPVIAAGLCAAIWFVFAQTLGHDFVNYDDGPYVYDNPAVVRGLTWQGVTAAFTQTDIHLWTPLTRISHMTVAQFFGMAPWAHHLGNVLLHAATAVTLFIAFWRMTDRIWRSAFVAVTFSIHPLHVESVAWVAERKDTLSGFFFALILLVYTSYARHPSQRWRYWTVVGLFAAGLLAKPILVTLPFLLLLLDYWPLNRVPHDRLRWDDWWPRLREKLPLFLLTGLSLWFVFFDPLKLNGPPATVVNPPGFSLRLANAIVSYSVYIWQLFWPARLSVRYPFPSAGVPAYQVVASFLFLSTVSVLAWWSRKRRPYLLAGWLWYLGMLFPVSQIATLGSEAHCDRYTYLSQIGLYICIAWTCGDLLAGWRHGERVAWLAGGVATAAMLWLAHAQAAHWKNSISLWANAIATTTPDAVTLHNHAFALATEDPFSDEALKQYRAALRLQPKYPEAENNLGLALAARGQFDEAMGHYERALRDDPAYLFAANNLAVALAQKGRLAEAADRLETVLRAKPTYAEARDNLGLVFAAQGRLDEATHQHELAIAAKPQLAEAHNHLGEALARSGKTSDALRSYQRALQLKPTFSAAHLNLGLLLAAQHRTSEAIAEYEAAVRLDPRSQSACNNLAWVLATSPEASLRNGARAVELAERAAQLNGKSDPAVLDTLAAAYAETGNFDKAATTITGAIELARQANHNDLAGQLEERRQLYLERRPYRD